MIAKGNWSWGLKGALNFYSYCEGDPVNFWDLNGLIPTKFPFYRDPVTNEVKMWPMHYSVKDYSEEEVAIEGLNLLICESIEDQLEYSLKIKKERYGGKDFYVLHDLRIGERDRVKIGMTKGKENVEKEQAYIHTHPRCGVFPDGNARSEEFSPGDKNNTMPQKRPGSEYETGDWFRNAYVGTVTGHAYYWDTVSGREGNHINLNTHPSYKYPKLDLSKCKCAVKKYNRCQ